MKKTYSAQGNKLLLHRIVPLNELKDEVTGLPMLGSIILPESSTLHRQKTNPLNEMRVASAGPLAQEFVGKVVLVNQHTWQEFPISDDETFYLVDSSQVIAIVSEHELAPATPAVG